MRFFKQYCPKSLRSYLVLAASTSLTWAACSSDSSATKDSRLVVQDGSTNTRDTSAGDGSASGTDAVSTSDSQSDALGAVTEAQCTAQDNIWEGGVCKPRWVLSSTDLFFEDWKGSVVTVKDSSGAELTAATIEVFPVGTRKIQPFNSLLISGGVSIGAINGSSIVADFTANDLWLEGTETIIQRCKPSGQGYQNKTVGTISARKLEIERRFWSDCTPAPNDDRILIEPWTENKLHVMGVDVDGNTFDGIFDSY